MAYYLSLSFFFFFFNDTATTEIYTLSLHDALPILTMRPQPCAFMCGYTACIAQDRKSTRLNSSHVEISYAVFCLKKKKKNTYKPHRTKKNNTTHTTAHNTTIS